MSAIATDIHRQNWLSLVLTKGAWYLFSSLFSKGLNLVLLPVYTRYLPPNEFGILNTLLAMAQILPIAMSLYLDAAFARFFHEYKSDFPALRRLFSTVYWFVLVWGGAVLLVTLFFAPGWASHFLDVPFIYLALAFVPTLFLQVAQLGLVFLRQSLDSRRTTLLEVSSAVISLLLTIPLLVVWELGVLARLIGAVAPAIFLFCYYTWFFRARGLLGAVFDKKLAQTCLLFSIPLLPNLMSGWISGMSDRLILARYATSEAVGIYSLGVTFSSLLYVLQDAVTQVTGPTVMSGLIHDKDATLQKMAHISLVLWAAMLAANLFLVLFSPEIVAVFATHAYSEASSIIAICGFAYVLSPQYRIFTDVISYHKRTWVLTVAAFLMAGTSLGLNFVVIPRWGINGAAGVFVFSVFVYTGWIYAWSRKYEKVPVPWKAAAMVFLLFGIACWLSTFLSSTTLLSILAKLAILGLFSMGAHAALKSVKL